MTLKFFKTFSLALFLLVTAGIVFGPTNYVQAACSPKVAGIAAQPTTVSKAKPNTTIKVTISGLTGCDATTAKGVKVFVKVENLDTKIINVDLINYATKFKGKTTYVIEQSINVITNSAVKDLKSFKIRGGVTSAGKDIVDNTHSTTITNSSGSKDAPAKTAANQDVSTAEKTDETGGSGFVICGNTVDTPCNITHLFRAFIIIINYLITMAGFVAVLFIVIAGVQMTISQGQEQLKQAKGRLAGAVIGLILVALAFVLINSLLAGSLDLGIKQGGEILKSPRNYINQSTTAPSDISPPTSKSEAEVEAGLGGSVGVGAGMQNDGTLQGRGGAGTGISAPLR